MRRLFLFLCLLGVMNAAHAACPALLNQQFTSLQGEKIDLCNYQDRAIMIVNTASKCGFTPQFEKLEGMYRKYKDKGLMVIGFPSNDFNQELSSDKEIGQFCKQTYAVEFPMISKGSVVGPNANWLHKQLYSMTGQQPMWNFHKYIILPGATKVYSFSTDVEPDSPQIMGVLKPYLK